MAERTPAQGGAFESIADFMARRRRETENFGAAAVAATNQAVGNAIRTGKDLALKTSDEVMRYGAGLLNGDNVRSRTVASKPQSSVGPATGQRPKLRPTENGGKTGPSGPGLDQNPAARAVVTQLAQTIGGVTGVARGAVHGMQGLGEGAVFLSRLVDPLDAWKSPPGESAMEQLVDAGKGVVDYSKQVVAHPQSLVRDVKNKAHEMNVKLNPAATPVASTLAGDFRRNFDIAQNQGELLFDVGSLVVGGPLAKGVGKLGGLSKATNAEKYLAQGFSSRAAEYLAQPYKGKGHHFVPQRKELPKIFSESEFNVLKPHGISRGDFYERHYRVDPHFHGAGLAKQMEGETWNGKRLGLEKYGMPGRIWYGSPAPLKARVIGVIGAGGPIQGYSDQEY